MQSSDVPATYADIENYLQFWICFYPWLIINREVIVKLKDLNGNQESNTLKQFVGAKGQNKFIMVFVPFSLTYCEF